MNYLDSFFEIPSSFPLDNTWAARLHCLKDFLIRIALLPVALVYKACKTFSKAGGLSLGIGLLLLTLGSSMAAREFFTARLIALAQDLADWVLLPFALSASFLRLLLALLVHPQFYFSALA